MSKIKTIQDVERMVREDGYSAIGICVECERISRPDVVKFIPELIRRGHPIECPGRHCAFPLLYAFEYCCMTSLQMFLKLVPNLGKRRDNNDNTIVHAAACSGSKDMVDLALSLCPEGLNYTNALGQTPLMYGSSACLTDLTPSTRELVLRGCDMNTPCAYTLNRVAVPRQILDYLFEHCLRNGLWKLCIAYGARPDGRRYASYTCDIVKEGTIPPWHYRAVDAVEKCRSSAYSMLSLARARGNVQGNGRDVLRLIAKEVWMSRMNDEWEK